MNFSCTDDRGALPTWQIRRDGIERELSDYPGWRIRGFDEGDYFMVRQTSGDEITDTLYYKKYPACFADITVRNTPENRESLDRMTSFFKHAVSPVIPSRQFSGVPISYFVLPSPSLDLRTIRSIDANGEISVLLGVRYPQDAWIHGIVGGRSFVDRA